MAITTLITIGPPIDLVALTDSPSTTGTVLAMPARRVQLTWQTVMTTAPASCTIKLMGSDDGSNFIQIDSTTSTTGDIKTVNSSVRFIRCDVTAHSSGAGFQVIGVCKA